MPRPGCRGPALHFWPERRTIASASSAQASASAIRSTRITASFVDMFASTAARASGRPSLSTSARSRKARISSLLRTAPREAAGMPERGRRLEAASPARPSADRSPAASRPRHPGSAPGEDAIGTSPQPSGVSRSACSPRTAARGQLPGRRPRQRPRRPARRAARPERGVARARWRARNSSSPTTSARARCSSRRSRVGDCLAAAAASNGWAARARSRSTTATPASTASSTVPASTIVDSCDTLRSGASASASSTLRTGAARRPTRIPSRSSIESGTGSSSPGAGGPRSNSRRPSSRANSGLPMVESTRRRSSGRGRLSPSGHAAVAE